MIFFTRNNPFPRAALALSLFLWACVVLATQWDEVLVISVIDGDTVKVLDASQEEKIRLSFIDAPEMGQPYGKASKQALAKKIFRKKIQIERHGKDQYGRTLATLWLEKKDVNLQMVQEGHAWVYRRYTQNPAYFEAESKAKALRNGLWRLAKEQRHPPWQWRRQEALRKKSSHDHTNRK